MTKKDMIELTNNISGIADDTLKLAKDLIDSGLIYNFEGLYPDHQGFIKFYKDLNESIVVTVQNKLYKVESIERVEPVYCYTLDDVRDALR